jgi:hypothetical protein
MTFILTNDAFAKVGDRFLFDIVKQDIFDNSKDKMCWKSVDDVPDDDVYEDIHNCFSWKWGEFKENLGSMLDDNNLVLVGKVGRWDGPAYFSERITSGLRTICEYLQDCGTVTVREDDEGRLFIEGVHHDGHNSAEIRILTDEGLESLRDDAVFDPGAEGMTKPLRYSDRFLVPQSVTVRPRSWLWDVIKDWGETNDWEEDDGAPEYYQKAIEPLADAEKTGIRVTDAAYGVDEEKEGLDLVALFGGLNGPGKWPDYLKALTAIVEKLEARVVYMNVDAPDDVFYVILLVPEKEEN